MKKIIIFIIILISSRAIGQLNKVKKGMLAAHKMSFYTSNNKNVNNNSCFIEVQSFEISELITSNQYLKFLKCLKKDSTIEYYTLLKIKNIKTKETAFIFKPKKNLPIVNVSWLQANEYCKWLTTKHKGFSYKIPNLKQWFYCFHNIELLNINFPNELYSEWLYNTKDESSLNCQDSMFNFSFPLDFNIMKMDSTELQKQFKTKTLLRKYVVGTSWRLPNVYNSEMYKYFNFYANDGYPSIGFRVVRINKKYIKKYEPRSRLIIKQKMMINTTQRK